ncbi:MAG: hypothetical protein IT250_01700 [Chitinophagaceae bacterium]|nr:hypothetical protein [Chitinophagaceae bacterium]
MILRLIGSRRFDERIYPYQRLVYF